MLFWGKNVFLLCAQGDNQFRCRNYHSFFFLFFFLNFFFRVYIESISPWIKPCLFVLYTFRYPCLENVYVLWGMYMQRCVVDRADVRVIEVRCLHVACGLHRWHHAICFQLFNYLSVLFQVIVFNVCLNACNQTTSGPLRTCPWQTLPFPHRYCKLIHISWLCTDVCLELYPDTPVRHSPVHI